jgi:hypothetical protein
VKCALHFRVHLPFYSIPTPHVSPDAYKDLHHLLSTNMRISLQPVSAVGTHISDGPTPALLDPHIRWDGLHCNPSTSVGTLDPPEKPAKHAQPAALRRHCREVYRFCRDSTVNDPKEVKQSVKEGKMPDPRRRIRVCAR